MQHGDPARFRDLGDLSTIIGVLERTGVVGIAVAVGWWCTRAGVPASWIFAFLVVFGIYALCRNRAVTPPARLMQPAQVLIAMVCTAPLMELDGQTIRSYLLPTVLSVIVMLVVSTVAGMLLARSGHTDPVSAMISTLAGGASAMALMARELHLDVRFVVVTQYLRLTLVVLTLPVFVHLLGGGDSGSGSGGSDWWQPDPRPMLGAVTVWALTWFFVRITRRFFAVPAPFLLIPIAVTWLLALCGVPQDWLAPHGVVLTLAYAVIGVQAGGTLTVSALRQLAHALPMILTAVTVMVLGTVGAALVIAHFTDISRLDAYLATVPGGIYAVLAFAHESGSSAVVTVGQVLRTLVMIVVGAYLPKLVAGGSRIVSSRRARKRSSTK